MSADSKRMHANTIRKFRRPIQRLQSTSSKSICSRSCFTLVYSGMRLLDILEPIGNVIFTFFKRSTGICHLPGHDMFKHLAENGTRFNGQKRRDILSLSTIRQTTRNTYWNKWFPLPSIPQSLCVNPFGQLFISIQNHPFNLK
jgi:hypothetical protein